MAVPEPVTASRPKHRTLSTEELAIGDLPERLRAATADDTCKGMFFNSVLTTTEAMAGVAARAQVQALLPERKYIDFFNYPSTAFLPAAFTAARLMQAQLGSFDDAVRRLGEQAILDFLATPVGHTLLSVSSGNMKRLMQATPIAYKTAVSYGTRETVMAGETGCVFKMRRDLMPAEYHQGVFLAVLRSVEAKVVEVKIERVGLLDADLHLRWA